MTAKRLITAALAILLTLPLAACGETKETQRVVYAMDTVMTLTAYGKNANAGLNAAESIMPIPPA